MADEQEPLGAESTHQCPACKQFLRVIEERGKLTIYCSNGCCDSSNLNEGATGVSVLEAFVLLCKKWDDFQEGR